MARSATRAAQRIVNAALRCLVRPAQPIAQIQAERRDDTTKGEFLMAARVDDACGRNREEILRQAVGIESHVRGGGSDEHMTKGMEEPEDGPADHINLLTTLSLPLCQHEMRVPPIQESARALQ